MRVTVTGYASLDHAMLVDRLPAADQTSIIRRRLSTTWPAAGGAAHVARAVRRADTATGLVTWLGDDAAGDRYVEHLAAADIDLAGVDRSGQRSPTSWLFYGPEGHAACCFDPGDVRHALTDPQRELIRTSDWWVAAVGPPAVTRTILDELDSATGIGWVVKADREAFPPELVDRLLRRADVITFSRSEQGFLEQALGGDKPRERTHPDALLITTGGSDPVAFRGPGGTGTVPVDPLPAVDTTGAGDTLAGAAVAALADGASPRGAVEHGVDAAHALLTTRMARDHD